MSETDRVEEFILRKWARAQYSDWSSLDALSAYRLGLEDALHVIRSVPEVEIALVEVSHREEGPGHARVRIAGDQTGA